MMRDQENPNESFTPPPKAPEFITMDGIELFKHYLESSAEVRRLHGVGRKDGKWFIENLDLIKGLSDEKKEVLRNLLRENKLGESK